MARFALAALAGAIVLLAGWRTVDRNFDWKDDHTLFTRDVLTSPNSALLNANASLYYLDAAELPANAPRRKELLMTAKTHLERAIEIHPRFASAHINLGLVHFRLGRLDDAEREWLLADTLRKNDPMVRNNLRSLGESGYSRRPRVGLELAMAPCARSLRKGPALPSGECGDLDQRRQGPLLAQGERSGARGLATRAAAGARCRDAVAGLAAIGDKPP